jgi:hypothetical protein
VPFPTARDSYQDSGLESTNAQLLHRISLEPVNLVATLIYLCAIVQTFMASKFMAMSHARGQAHQEKTRTGEAREGTSDLIAGVYRFPGEVEVVFGLWSVPLILAILLFHDWATLVHYVEH